jgi:hypothetical protein
MAITLRSALLDEANELFRAIEIPSLCGAFFNEWTIAVVHDCLSNKKSAPGEGAEEVIRY